MSSSMDPSSVFARPQPLPVSKVCVYKTVGKLAIPVDVYFPFRSTEDGSPIMLFIHGGGWIGSNRSDYSRPLFHEFLALGFVVTSMDYRLLPETSFDGQQEDVRDIELWLKEELQRELQGTGHRCDPEKIIVVGGSAGAHLALLTPKLWRESPNAILSMYGPTNFHYLPWLDRGRLARMRCLPCTPSLLAEATDYNNPPTGLPFSVTPSDLQKPRQYVSLNFFREELVSEFLVKGLVRGEGGKLSLPPKGSVSKEDIDAISPIHLHSKYHYPPVCQVIGTSDEIFPLSHVDDFHSALKAQGIPAEKIIIPGAGHAFDVREHIGSDVHEKVLRPAVKWVAKWVGGSNSMNSPFPDPSTCDKNSSHYKTSDRAPVDAASYKE